MKVQPPVSDAIWAAKKLFDRGKTFGSSANISFRMDHKIYISGSGTCFGTLSITDFAICDEDGVHITGPTPSKELQLHMALYRASRNNRAIIHTHSLYSVLWSCLEDAEDYNRLFRFTPYLKIKVGAVAKVPYAPPGSPELLDRFSKAADADHKGYILSNHGLIVTADSVMEAFYNAEELEESARVAWMLRAENTAHRI